MSIVLCGFMGCGKSTVGRLIADRLKMRFVDTDELIEQTEGRRIKDIFAVDGESGFRDIEHNICEKIAEADNCVIAVGGGALTFKRNVALFKNRAVIVFLDVPYDIILRRIGHDENRPLMNEKSERLYNDRHPLYADAADIIISVGNDLSCEQTAERIIKAYLDGRDKK